MDVESDSKEEAVTKMQANMTQEELDKHWEQNHQGDTNKPTLEQSHEMIAQRLHEVAAA